MIHSNRCSNHFLGSSSWRKIIVVASLRRFPIIFASHSILSFLYSVLKVLSGGSIPPFEERFAFFEPPAKEIDPEKGLGKYPPV